MNIFIILLILIVLIVLILIIGGSRQRAENRKLEKERYFRSNDSK